MSCWSSPPRITALARRRAGKLKSDEEAGNREKNGAAGGRHRGGGGGPRGQRGPPGPFPFAEGSGHGIARLGQVHAWAGRTLDRKSTRLNSSHLVISYAVFCLKN